MSKRKPKHPAPEVAEVTSDFAQGYTDGMLHLEFRLSGNPEYEDGYNTALRDEQLCKRRAND